MKIKILIFVLLVSFLTGCTVDVELKVSSNSISEKVQFINYIDEEHTEESILKSFKKYEPNNINDLSKIVDYEEKASGVSYYDREQEVYNTFIKNTYSSEYKLSDYNYSRTLKVFKEASIVDGIDYIEISTDKNGLMLYNTYSDLGDIKVAIKTDLTVIDNNADDVKDGSYIWHFSKNDNQRNIYIKMKKNNSNGGVITVNRPERELMDGNLQTLYLTLVLLAFGLIVALFSTFLIKVASS